MLALVGGEENTLEQLVVAPASPAPCPTPVRRRGPGRRRGQRWNRQPSSRRARRRWPGRRTQALDQAVVTEAQLGFGQQHDGQRRRARSWSHSASLPGSSHAMALSRSRRTASTRLPPPASTWMRCQSGTAPSQAVAAQPFRQFAASWRGLHLFQGGRVGPRRRPTPAMACNSSWAARRADSSRNFGLQLGQFILVGSQLLPQQCKLLFPFGQICRIGFGKVAVSSFEPLAALDQTCSARWAWALLVSSTSRRCSPLAVRRAGGSVPRWPGRGFPRPGAELHLLLQALVGLGDPQRGGFLEFLPALAVGGEAPGGLAPVVELPSSWARRDSSWRWESRRWQFPPPGGRLRRWRRTCRSEAAWSVSPAAKWASRLASAWASRSPAAPPAGPPSSVAAAFHFGAARWRSLGLARGQPEHLLPRRRWSLRAWWRRATSAWASSFFHLGGEFGPDVLDRVRFSRVSFKAPSVSLRRSLCIDPSRLFEEETADRRAWLR